MMKSQRYERAGPTTRPTVGELGEQGAHRESWNAFIQANLPG
jgi:hypothetical protein